MPFGSGAIGEGEAFGLPASADPSPARFDDVSAEQVGRDANRIAAAHVARGIDCDQVDGCEQGDSERFHALESSRVRRHCLTSILNHRALTDSVRESIRGFGAGLVRLEAPTKIAAARPSPMTATPLPLPLPSIWLDLHPACPRHRAKGAATVGGSLMVIRLRRQDNPRRHYRHPHRRYLRHRCHRPPDRHRPRPRFPPARLRVPPG